MASDVSFTSVLLDWDKEESLSSMETSSSPPSYPRKVSSSTDTKRPSLTGRTSYCSQKRRPSQPYANLIPIPDSSYYFDPKREVYVLWNNAENYNAMMNQANNSHSLFRQVKFTFAADKISNLKNINFMDKSGIRAIHYLASAAGSAAVIGASVMTFGLFAIAEGINVYRDRKMDREKTRKMTP